MIVYLNSNGTIEQVVPQNLTQGSNNENLIVVGSNLSSFTALSAVFKLPNKQVLAPILMTKQQSNYVINNEIVNVWTCDLNEAVTNFSGTLELTINANAGGVITNSYTGAVQIAPTNAPSFPTIDQSAVEVFNQIFEVYGHLTGELELKQDKLDESLDTVDKTVVGAINEINTKETQNAGDIAEIMSDINTIQGDINDIENGTTIVAKASADQNGDNIVNTYQKKADNGLDTVNKTVVGGINELKDQAVLNSENIQEANNEIVIIKNNYATKVYVDNEIASIRIGAVKTLVFDTKQNFLDWLSGTYQRVDGKLPSSLNIGDTILIKELDVPDYWVSSKSDPMTINDFSEYEVKIEIPETKIDDESITKNSAEELQAVKLKNAFTNIDTTVTKSDFSGATKLSKVQYYELLQYGQIEVDGQVITFSDEEFYITPDLSEDFDDRISDLEASVTQLAPQVARALKTPMSAPSSTQLVSIDTSNSQAMISIGDGLVVENNTLKATGGGGGSGGSGITLKTNTFSGATLQDLHNWLQNYINSNVINVIVKRSSSMRITANQTTITTTGTTFTPSDNMFLPTNFTEDKMLLNKDTWGFTTLTSVNNEITLQIYPQDATTYAMSLFFNKIRSGTDGVIITTGTTLIAENDLANWTFTIKYFE